MCSALYMINLMGAGLIGEEVFPAPNQNDQLAMAQEIILDRPNNAES